MCVCLSVCACVCVCMHACVCVCVCVHVLDRVQRGHSVFKQSSNSSGLVQTAV